MSSIGNSNRRERERDRKTGKNQKCFIHNVGNMWPIKHLISRQMKTLSLALTNERKKNASKLLAHSLTTALHTPNPPKKLKTTSFMVTSFSVHDILITRSDI